MNPLRRDREARVLLNMTGEPGHVRLAQLSQQLGPDEVVARLREGGPGAAAEVARRLDEVDPAAVLRTGALMGLRFVIPGDEEWPPELDELAFAPSLHDRAGTPVGLWLRGPAHLREVCDRAVAVVGSRSATTYGQRVASDIAVHCAEAGHTVISGGAFGIDQAAHRGALAGGGTMAVLACGADRTYPKSNHDLLEHIARTSVVVSEAPLGGDPLKVRFLARNRLIAALSVGTVVVEAARRSGALNTATWAAHLGRILMGVPGPVVSATSAGVHALIRENGAQLVTGGADVLEAISSIGDLRAS